MVSRGFFLLAAGDRRKSQVKSKSRPRKVERPRGRLLLILPAERIAERFFQVFKLHVP